MPWRYRVALWMDAHADPDWRFVHRLWSARLAVIIALAEGAFAATGAFQSYFTPGQFLAICCVLSLVPLLGRLIKQPSIPDA